MKSRIFAILPLFTILLSSTIIPYSFASVESEAQEDLQAGCREGQFMVYRFAYLDYVCVNPSTAERWEELQMAEIVQNETKDGTKTTSEITVKKEIPEIHTLSVPSPHIPKKSLISEDSECREGYVLVYRFVHHDSFCTSHSTASSWKNLGLAEIITPEKSEEYYVEIEDQQEPIIEDKQEPIIEDKQEPIIEDKQEPIIEDKQEPIIEDKQEPIVSEFPKILRIEERIWGIIDHDETTSVLIEGDSGIIAIDSLNSYKSMKKAITEFQTISEQKIKVIIFTTLTPESLSASSALIEAGDGDVEIILSEELLDVYESDNGLTIDNAITYADKFSINIVDVKIDMISVDGFFSDQTYLSLPNYEGMLIGDSELGIFPLVLDMGYLQDFELE